MYKVFWYTSESGRTPVEEELDSLSQPDRACAYAHIKMLEEHGHRLTAPYVKTIKGKLRELRFRIRPGQYRIFFFFHHGGSIYLLHSFLKKTQKTPDHEIRTAEKRMKAITGGN